MECTSGFSKKYCLSLPELGWKYSNSLRTKEDEPIYTYNDKFMKWFVRQSIKGGRVCAFNQYYKSKTCDDILKIISEDFNVKGKFYDNIEAFLIYKNKYFKNFEKETKINLTIIEIKMKKKEKKISMKN